MILKCIEIIFLKIRREIVVIGDYAAVSSQLQIIHTYDSHYAKGEPWNSLMKVVSPSYWRVLELIARSLSLIC